MKGDRRPRGYTIIEVMIVLAISGVMFLIAATLISGKQERTSFDEGVNDLASNIQDVIEQVTDGQYSDIPLDCTFSNPPPVVSINDGTNNQGTNEGCVFLGKVMRFENDSSTYSVISIAGARLDPSSLNGATPQANLDNSAPTVIEPTGASLTITQTIDQDLTVDCVIINNPTGTCAAQQDNKGNDFGFIQSVGSEDSNFPGSFQSGAQTIWLVSDIDLADTDADRGLNDNLSIGTSSATLCITDGTRYATIDVGASNGNQLSANVIMKGTTKC